MEQVIQVTGLCVVGALLALVVKRGSPETALLLAEKVFRLAVRIRRDEAGRTYEVEELPW